MEVKPTRFLQERSSVLVLDAFLCCIGCCAINLMEADILFVARMPKPRRFLNSETLNFTIEEQSQMEVKPTRFLQERSSVLVLDAFLCCIGCCAINLMEADILFVALMPKLCKFLNGEALNFTIEEQ